MPSRSGARKRPVKKGAKSPMAKKKQKKASKKKSVKKVSKKAVKKLKRPILKSSKKSGGATAAKTGKGAKGKKGKPETKLEKALKGNAKEINELIERGRPRGFVTDNEILYYFPKIEDNVDLLDEIYDRLEKAGIKVIETSAL